jgi:Zn-dependent peptidase ImmA (M78 family)
MEEATDYWARWGWSVLVMAGPCNDDIEIPAGVVVARWADPPPGQVGRGYRRDERRAIVLIREDPPPQAGRALAHELGHALVGLDHSDGPWTLRWGRLMEPSQRAADEWLLEDEHGDR